MIDLNNEKIVEVYNRIKKDFDNISDKFVGFLSFSDFDGVPCSVPISFTKVCGSFGVEIYCMTDSQFIHSRDLVGKKEAYISIDNMQIRCMINFLGSTRSEGSKEAVKHIKEMFESNWNRYGELPNQIVFKLTPIWYKGWKYVDEKPYRFLVVLDKYGAYAGVSSRIEEYKACI